VTLWLKQHVRRIPRVRLPSTGAHKPAFVPMHMHIYKERNSGNEDEWLTYKNQRLVAGHGDGILP